ncbi:glycosyltransferase family 4 protein [Fibrobacter sp. UWB12]|uniref:glycosyltransferase family 4 protein n=1 Tax=Fibrobacter sp. UWB12 TaxID=1896203 RepID=UPI00090F6C94|nr:glycosyltransferase family 4 protein [Fibrobacter sp. UWB12]SHK26641.1 Glycosyltransferase involved in cell wall bisynthesis [Fibrobacter sp. UWB12]
MKVLFVTHYSFLLGSNRSLESLVKYFLKQGVAVSVLMPSRGLFFQHLHEMGVDVHCVKFFFEAMYVKLNKKYLILPILWLYNLFAFFLLLYKVRMINPDIIYSNSSADCYSILVAKLLQKKHVMHVREFMQEDFGARYIFGRKSKKSKILKSDKIIFVSKAVAKSVVGEIPQNGRVVYNGLPIPNAIEPFHLNRQNVRLGIVGNIDISKQQHLIIGFMPQILKKYPGLTLHIVGDKESPYKRRIVRQVKDLKVEKNVFFEGFVRNTDDIYSKFDILVMCSRSEAFGRVTIEAMLRNKPVIGLDAGGTPELIKSGVTGFQFVTETDFLKRLAQVINDVENTKRIVDCARKYAVDNFAEIVYCRNVYDFVIE